MDSVKIWKTLRIFFFYHSDRLGKYKFKLQERSRFKQAHALTSSLLPTKCPTFYLTETSPTNHLVAAILELGQTPSPPPLVQSLITQSPCVQVKPSPDTQPKNSSKHNSYQPKHPNRPLARAFKDIVLVLYRSTLLVANLYDARGK